MKENKFLTGILDQDRIILSYIDNDETILTFCKSNYGRNVCNQEFFEKYLKKYYPAVVEDAFMRAYYMEDHKIDWRREYFETVYFRI